MLAIVELDLERGFDTLIVKDGILYTYYLIVALTGTVKLHTIASTEDSLYLEFYSDRTGSGKGFRVNLRKFTNVDGKFRGLLICDSTVSRSVSFSYLHSTYIGHHLALLMCQVLIILFAVCH